MTPVRRLLAAVAAAALASCNPGFAPQYRVTDLRILAIRSIVVSTGWADGDPGTGTYPGDTLRLEALVANPLSRAPVTATWYACLTLPGQLPPCLDPTYLSDPSRLATAEAAARGVVALAAFGTPSSDGMSIDVPLAGPSTPAALVQAMENAYAAIVAAATADAQFRCRTYVELPVVLTVEAGGRRETAVRNVRLAPIARLAADHPEWTASAANPGYVRNSVPSIAGISADPANADACTGGTDVPPGAVLAPGHHVLCGAAAAGSVQEYWQCGGDGVNAYRAEQLAWQWYATDGTFSGANGVGNVIDGAPGFDRPAGAFTLWLIVRDGRGGESWTSRTFPAAP